jgi:hypothetical protein
LRDFAIAIVKHRIQKTDQDIMALFRAKDFLECKISFWTNKFHDLRSILHTFILAKIRCELTSQNHYSLIEGAAAR